MKKLYFMLIAVLIINSNIFADNFSAESNISSDETVNSFSDFDTKSIADNTASDAFGSTEIKKTKIEFNGNLILNNEFINDGTTGNYQKFEGDISVSKTNSDLKVKLIYDTMKDEITLDEGTLRLYYDKYDVLAGKTKIVWGKGDKLHVIDNFNAEDMNELANPNYFDNYLDKRIPENILQFNYYTGNGNLEFDYAPQTTTIILSDNDLWKTYGQKKLESFLSSYASQSISAYSAVSGLKEKLNSNNDAEDGQFGLRYTNSKNGYDYGISYYHGAEKTATLYYNNQKITSSLLSQLASLPISYADLSLIDVDYNKLDVVGAEFSSVLFGVNSRAEMAYYNIENEDNQIQLLVGGDKDLPLHNANINVQIKSIYTIDADSDNFSDLLAINISDKFRNERILPQIKLLYNMEDKDYMLGGQVEFILKDNTSLKLIYNAFEGKDDTDFGQFDNNDYFAASFKYSF